MHHAANGWIYCASIEPETAEEQAAWRSLMPDGRDVASPIRRPREFSRAFGAMVVAQAGPRGRIVVLRNAVEGPAQKSQTIYHGRVAYLDDPCRRLESASSELEFALLFVFLKETARRAQREYPSPCGLGGGRAGGRHAGSRCLGGAGRRDGETAAGAGRQRLRARAGGVLVAGAGRDTAGLRRRRRRGRATWRRRPAIRARRWPAYAAVEALREAVDAADVGCRKDVAAAAWHAEPLLRFLSTALGGRVPRVWVSEDGFIAVTTELSAVVEASIAVGPEGSFACTVSTATRISRARRRTWRSFERALKERLAEVGVPASGQQP